MVFFYRTRSVVTSVPQKPTIVTVILFVAQEKTKRVAVQPKLTNVTIEFEGALSRRANFRRKECRDIAAAKQ